MKEDKSIFVLFACSEMITCHFRAFLLIA
ncbi:hypothetical protein SPV_2477 [Streptococcus pneumoniae]|nr:hypothetical protein SPV_2477 [Streptococcus pneumoniae]